MRAITRTTYGGGEALQVTEQAIGEPGEGEVRLRVHGSSVNKGDRLVLAGEPYVMRLMLGMGAPNAKGMGQDVSGVVEAVGAGVTDWKVGDAVFGEITFGSCWAEQVIVSADKLAKAPTSIPLDEVGTLPVAALTALQAVRVQGGVTAGQRVLVNGAAGSVGAYAVQIAAARGAEVTGVCSAKSAARVRELGAAHTIDYAAENFTETDAPYDVLIDIAGTHSFKHNLRAVKPDGVLVVVGGPVDDPWLTPVLRPLVLMLRGLFVRQRVAVFVSAPSRGLLEELAGMVDDGKLTAAYESACALDALPGAVAELDAGVRRGKVFVRVASSDAASG